MNHEQLWAPWRLGYIKGEEPALAAPSAERWLPGADRECFICRAAADGTDQSGLPATGLKNADQSGLPATGLRSTDRSNLVVHRGERTITILNRYPYNNGHLLVAVLRHAGRLDELSAEEHLESMQVAARMIGLLERRINAEGFNVGLNLGRVAGAGLPGHLHWHVVPRWHGDTNFMPALAGIKVIPQSLDALWELLTAVGD